MKGWVYIITDNSLPNLLKVELDTREPEQVAKEFNAMTPPHRFTAEYGTLVDDTSEIEQKVHAILNYCNEKEGWFKCDISVAIAAIRQAANNPKSIEARGLIYEATFKITPPIKQSENINKFSFIVNENNINETFTTTKQSLITRYNAEKKEIVVARNNIEKAFDTDKILIREILLRNMLYIKLYQPINIEMLSEPILVNRKEITGDGIKIWNRIIKELDLVVTHLDINDWSLVASEKYWNDSSINYKNELLNIAGWIERSQTATNPIDKFIHVWIAFNSLYNLYVIVIKKENKLELERAKITTRQFISESQAKNIFVYHSKIIEESLGSDNFIRDFIDKNSKNEFANLNIELGRKENSKDYIKIISLTIGCIYFVRNQIFHEAPQSPTLPIYTEKCNELLLAIVSACVKNFMMPSSNNENIAE